MAKKSGLKDAFNTDSDEAVAAVNASRNPFAPDLIDGEGGTVYVEVTKGRRVPADSPLTLSLSLPAAFKLELQNYAKAKRLPMVQVIQQAVKRMITEELEKQK